MCVYVCMYVCMYVNILPKSQQRHGTIKTTTKTKTPTTGCLEFLRVLTFLSMLSSRCAVRWYPR